MKHLIAIVWLVQWTSVYKAEAPCPNTWQVDEYTQEIVNPFHVKDQPAVMKICTENRRKQLERRFYTRAEVDAFIKNCPPGVCSKWDVKEMRD